ncbi:hypothetical protein B0H11DRAFT_2348739 [Mycena galericulata]|nr:hypothetical protein B0H11DRAFT_2348739 [Mycena galericulata]
MSSGGGQQEDAIWTIVSPPNAACISMKKRREIDTHRHPPSNSFLRSAREGPWGARLGGGGGIIILEWSCVSFTTEHGARSGCTANGNILKKEESSAYAVNKEVWKARKEERDMTASGDGPVGLQWQTFASKREKTDRTSWHHQILALRMTACLYRTTSKSACLRRREVRWGEYGSNWTFGSRENSESGRADVDEGGTAA